ncbi:MAG: Aspartokinase [Alyxoria varia]|nr:MAG: Aspartokinase [Alyxoria varia]
MNSQPQHAPVLDDDDSEVYDVTNYKSADTQPPTVHKPTDTLLSGHIQHHTEEKNLPGGWIVQKFGGTSVGKGARPIAEGIVAVALKENRIAVVCSARSSSTKSAGTTNRLLRAAREAEKAHAEAWTSVVEAIREDHVQAASSTLRSPLLIEKLIKSINQECDRLMDILQSAHVLKEVSARTEDMIMSKGEKLSCLFMTELLRDCGVNAVQVDLTDMKEHVPDASSSSTSHRLDEAFYGRIANVVGKNVLSAWPEHQDLTGHVKAPVVPVLTGYFGEIPGGLLASIGRGYTDLCAALVAVGLKAHGQKVQELQIWKEVDGIFTADPRKVPTARLLSSVSPAEAAELTFYGSEVIHPFTMEQVISKTIPVRIKNVMNPRGEGTIIVPDPAEDASVYRKAFLDDSSNLVRTRSTSSIIAALQRPKRPTAVTVKGNIVILNVHSNKRTRAHGFLMNIFRILDKWHLSVDLVSSSEVHVSMALHSETAALLTGPNADSTGVPDFPAMDGLPVDRRAQSSSGNNTTKSPTAKVSNSTSAYNIASDDLLGAVRELRAFGDIDLQPNMAIISLVGRQLRNMVGISGGFLSALGDNGINIEMISQGASEINISCVVDGAQADRALSTVHTHLFTFLE